MGMTLHSQGAQCRKGSLEERGRVRGRETGDAALLAVRMEGGAVKSWKSREPLEGPALACWDLAS